MREQWLEHTATLLRAAGFHSGVARAAVLNALAHTGGGLTAPELHEQARQNGRPVAAASVYRVLADLERLGAVRRLEIGRGEALFELVDPGSEHHHHLVCDSCGRTQRFADRDLEEALGRIERDASYVVHAHDVVLHGVCPRCRPNRLTRAVSVGSLSESAGPRPPVR